MDSRWTWTRLESENILQVLNYNTGLGKTVALDLGTPGRDTQQCTDLRNNYRVELTILVDVFSIHLLCARYPDRFWGFNSPSTHGTLNSMKNRDMDQKRTRFSKYN